MENLKIIKSGTLPGIPPIPDAILCPRCKSEFSFNIEKRYIYGTLYVACPICNKLFYGENWESLSVPKKVSFWNRLFKKTTDNNIEIKIWKVGARPKLIIPKAVKCSICNTIFHFTEGYPKFIKNKWYTIECPHCCEDLILDKRIEETDIETRPITDVSKKVEILKTGDPLTNIECNICGTEFAFFDKGEDKFPRITFRLRNGQLNYVVCPFCRHHISYYPRC